MTAPMAYADFPTDRAGIAAGYRRIADLIESGDAPIPMNIHVSFPINRDQDVPQAAAAAKLRRALGGGHWDKQETGSYLYLRGMCAGLPIQLWLDRDAVCERVVIGTEKITEVIPAVTEEDLRPEQTITRTVEHVEWICSPLLGADNADQVTA